MSDTLWVPVEVALADCPEEAGCDYVSCFPIDGEANVHIKWTMGGVTWSTSPGHLRFTVNSRGFKAMVQLDSAPSVRESSSAEEAKIWIDDEHITVYEARVRLTVGEYAGPFADQVEWLCDHHYQGSDAHG